MQRGRRLLSSILAAGSRQGNPSGTRSLAGLLVAKGSKLVAEGRQVVGKLLVERTQVERTLVRRNPLVRGILTNRSPEPSGRAAFQAVVGCNPALDLCSSCLAAASVEWQSCLQLASLPPQLASPPHQCRHFR